MQSATKSAMETFSDEVLTYAGRSIPCDLSEEQEDLENNQGGKRRDVLIPCMVLKSNIPSGVTFAIGGVVTIDATRYEISSFNQDEITINLTLVTPRQK